MKPTRCNGWAWEVSRVRILLTNDDGVYAPGLRALRTELLHLGEVTVVAPASEQSAVGHSITLLTPLIVQDTLVVALCTTSGCTVTAHVPRTALVCGSVIVKVAVEGARAPPLPPRFLSDAATTHVVRQPEVSTETTV